MTKRRRLHLLTYATQGFLSNAKGLAENALRTGFDSAQVLTPTEIGETAFYKANLDVLNAPRGGGYWLWKPYIILGALQALGDNDCLFYCDAGRSSYYRFRSRPDRLLERAFASEQGFLLGPAAPHVGSIRNWTKRDCLVFMNADVPDIRNKPLVMTWSLWRRSGKAVSFLETWLAACMDRRCLTDDPNVCGLPNHEDFRDHRHDQSILSILAHKHDAPFLSFDKTLVHRLLKQRPGSALAQNFYKRPQNVEDLLAGDNPYLLVREFFQLRKAN